MLRASFDLLAAKSVSRSSRLPLTAQIAMAKVLTGQAIPFTMQRIFFGGTSINYRSQLFHSISTIAFEIRYGTTKPKLLAKVMRHKAPVSVISTRMQQF